MTDSIVCCPLSSNDDGDAAQCYVVTTRKARKAHKCCECDEEISPGSKYEHVSGIWDGRPHTYKTCMSCVEIRDHFACGKGWLFEQLWNDLEENFFPDMKAGGPCMAGLSPAAKDRLFTRRMKWLEDSS